MPDLIYNYLEVERDFGRRCKSPRLAKLGRAVSGTGSSSCPDRNGMSTPYENVSHRPLVESRSTLIKVFKVRSILSAECRKYQHCFGVRRFWVPTDLFSPLQFCEG